MAAGGNPHPALTSRPNNNVHKAMGFPSPRTSPMVTPEIAADDWLAFWEGYVKTLGDAEKVTLAHQELFLDGMRKTGIISRSARAAGVTGHAVEYWLQTNKLHFKVRYEEAFNQFKEHLRELGVDRLENPTGRLGSDVLLIAYNNAYNPELFKRDGPIQVDSGLKELLTLFTKLAASSRRAPEVIEGTAQEVAQAQLKALSEAEPEGSNATE